MIYKLVLAIFSTLFVAARGSSPCPTTIRAPCICASTRYEPISIQCDQADSLETVIRALAEPPPYIDSLIISNTPIDTIPSHVFEGLSIKRLVFRNNGLESIQPRAFDGPLLDVLQELEIRSNKLIAIPQSGVPELRSLNTLILSDNHINYVPDYTFLTYYSRNVLRRIDLSSNNISILAPQSLLGLEDLRILALDKNLFTDIPTEALRNLVTLEEFSIGVNHIKQIPIGALPLPNLKSLSLEVNEISHIDQNAFQQIPNLLYLYLSNNQIHEIDPNLLYYVKDLKVLAMSNNPYLTSLHNTTFQYVPSLVRVELSDCGITHIEEGTFQRIPKIQVIVLSRNQLERVHQTMFTNLPHVLSIDVRQNKIKWVDDFAFSNLHELLMIDMSGNELETLLPHTFDESLLSSDETTTRVINIYDNPWMCNQQIDWFIKWLRENPDIQITAPGNRPARCSNPPHLRGMEFRHADPTILNTPSPELGQPNGSDVATDPMPIPTTIIKKPNKEVVTDVLENQAIPVDTTTTGYGQLFPGVVTKKPLPGEVDISNTSLILIVLGTLTVLLVVTFSLVAIIRYSIRKIQQQDDRRDLQSSSHGSATGSHFSPIYAGPGVFGCDRSSMSHYGTQNWNLRHSPELIDHEHASRPTYWWF